MAEGQRFAARAEPIAEAWAKAHVLALHLAAKIEADVAEVIRQKREHLPSLPPSPDEETRLRGMHPALHAWAGAQEDAEEARQVLLSVWPVLVTRDGHPARLKVPGGEVRLDLFLGGKPAQVRWVPGENRRSRRYCLEENRWASESCFAHDDRDGGRDHDTVLATCCTACEHTSKACDACREANG